MFCFHEEAVDEVLEAHSAGSPTDEAVRWTDLKLAQQVLVRAGYRRRVVVIFEVIG